MAALSTSRLGRFLTQIIGGIITTSLQYYQTLKKCWKIERERTYYAMIFLFLIITLLVAGASHEHRCFCHTRPRGKNHPIRWPKRAVKTCLKHPPTFGIMDWLRRISQQPQVGLYPNLKHQLR